MILAAATLLGTAGCTFLTPTATLNQYDPSDGVGTTVGSVRVSNAIALSNDEGDAVSLLVTFHNSGERTANVNLQFEQDGETTTITKPVRAGASASYGNTVDEDQIIITQPGVKPGQLFPVYLQYGDNEGTELLVPVLSGERDHYAPLMPPSSED